MSPPLRNAEAAETEALARLWHAAWQDGHAAVVPPGLLAIRTLDDFLARMPELIPGTVTAGPLGAPLGFCSVRGDEIYQLFVARAARGTGLAAALLRDGEARIAAAGFRQARLDVSPGNARAERFYEREGWRSAGPMMVKAKTTQGPFALEILRFVKDLPPVT